MQPHKKLVSRTQYGTSQRWQGVDCAGCYTREYGVWERCFMVQAQFNLDESLWAFVQKSRQYGFQNQDELIRVALGKLQQELDSLEMSADLYTEVYAEDTDLQALTDSALAGWPE
ncbi:hypothetical protein Q5691_07355 [Microcoleus sp. w1-18aA5]|uniref:hypothetical protein n=1 Tax=Microcoleus sp. w1-18aA5 TaxID=2818982 RepID=UPI002FD24B13